ncbi:phosphoenolpyruvate--protein phosphotransferase [Fodinibius sp. Rm-B-1B1-1]|uniref:phosphoenolpyruvate--protein phosphotransferase n=1 Tax=Fodinibius alkaliphilus TaxID=3140241 RepID=UPI00315A8A7C
MSEQTLNNEVLISGAPACPGIVIGKTSLYERERPAVSDENISSDEVQKHLDKFRDALEIAEEELKALQSCADVEEPATLIQMQIAILHDPDLRERIEQKITAQVPVDLAVERTFQNYLEVIEENHQKNAFQNKTVDISDIRDRLLQILHNKRDDIQEETILVARELSPREIISFSGRNIKGIITDRGGATSHAAIIARSMNIPTVVGTKEATEMIDSHDEVILDGRNGEIILNPNEGTRERYQRLMDQQSEREADFKVLCEKENKTTDGQCFTLQANIEFAEELTIAQKYCAEGVGLLRTESIYLGRESFQDIDQQVSFYRSILNATGSHPITIRLFDVGGDKFFEDDKPEQNPFLGWRGIRMLLEEQQILKNQLRAIYIASADFHGRIRILVPMVSTMGEVRQLYQIIDEIKQELTTDVIEIDENIPIGLMVEVPAVALKADCFAREADFLSIGTNDLTQYVLAVDRGNERISNLYDQRHPAIWELINLTAQAAKDYDIPVSVCGELASDPISACCLMGLGIDTLSMNSVVLPTVKQMLLSHSIADMQKLGQEVLRAGTLDDVDKIFSNWDTRN